LNVLKGSTHKLGESMANLPYVTAPGNIERALNGIKTAATPERVSQDFVKTILGIKGGSGDQMTSYLKKIGFANSDGSPSELYKRFRNSATTGAAAAEALRIGYAPLYTRNEYMHRLRDEDLKGVVIEETGQSEDSSPVALILTAIKHIKKFASFDEVKRATGAELTLSLPSDEPGSSRQTPPGAPSMQGFGMNIAYTINLNLPSTSDVSVFNALFKSLKENLLRNE
jgi:hypothetical protein